MYKFVTFLWTSPIYYGELISLLNIVYFNWKYMSTVMGKVISGGVLYLFKII